MTEPWTEPSGSWRERAYFLAQQICSVGFLAAVFLAPYLYGAVHPQASLALSALLFALSALWFCKKYLLDRDFSYHFPLWPLALLIFALLALQLLPLPPSLLQHLSPQSAQMNFGLAALAQEALGGWRPISLVPRETLGGGLLLLNYWMVFWIFSAKLQNKSFSRWTARLLLASAFVLSCLALFQKLSQAGGIYGFRPAGENFYGPFVNRNHCAAYLGTMIPFLFFYSANRHSRGKGTLAAMVVSLALLALLLSLSRGAILALLLCGAAMLASVYGRRRHFQLSRRRLYPAALALFLCLLLLLWLGWRGIGEKMSDLVGTPLPENYRAQVWRDTMKLVAAFPVFGCGLGGFASAFPSFQAMNTAYQIQFPENDYLQWAAEMGGLGAGLLCLGLVAYARRFRQALRREPPRRKELGASFALLFLLLHSLVNFNLAVPAIPLLAAVMAAYLYRGQR